MPKLDKSRSRWSPWFLVTLSLLAYGLLVSRPVQSFYYAADGAGYVDAHFLQYLGVTLSGLVTGLALGPWIGQWLLRVVPALLPKTPEGTRAMYLRSVAWSFILLSMVPPLLWTVQTLNLFVDVHRGLFVEANLLIFLMGVLNGTAWHVLVPRHAWLSLILAPAFLGMVLVNVLTPYSWPH